MEYKEKEEDYAVDFGDTGDDPDDDYVGSVDADS